MDRGSNAGAAAHEAKYTADSVEDMIAFDALPIRFRHALNAAPYKFSALQINELRKQMDDEPLLKAIINGG